MVGAPSLSWLPRSPSLHRIPIPGTRGGRYLCPTQESGTIRANANTTGGSLRMVRTEL